MPKKKKKITPRHRPFALSKLALGFDRSESTAQRLDRVESHILKALDSGDRVKIEKAVHRFKSLVSSLSTRQQDEFWLFKCDFVNGLNKIDQSNKALVESISARVDSANQRIATLETQLENVFQSYEDLLGSYERLLGEQQPQLLTSVNRITPISPSERKLKRAVRKLKSLRRQIHKVSSN